MTTAHNKLMLGQMLVAEGVITATDLEKALSYTKTHGGLIGITLLEQGSITEEQLVCVLSKQRGL